MMSDALTAAQIRPGSQRTLVGFVMDQATEALLRETLISETVTATFLRGGLRDAVRRMGEIESPDTLIIDITDCESDGSVLAALEELANIVEPEIEVIAISGNRDVALYRKLTRSMGIAEVLHKPLSRLDITELASPILTRGTEVSSGVRGGRVISVIGAKGGVGATMIATGLARYLGRTARRHTVLIDADFRHSACYVMMSVPPETPTGLRQLLERPERIDRLFVERATAIVEDRIHLLAADEKPMTPDPIPAGAADVLIEILRMRYNYVLIDLPVGTRAMTLDFARASNHKIIVMDPSLVSLKEVHRILHVDPGPVESQKPTIVLNRSNLRGGLSPKKIHDPGEINVDIEIPDLGSAMISAANMEGDAMSIKPFRAAIEKLAHDVGAVDTDRAEQTVRRGGLMSRLLGGR
jgi:pilus assembly protein CpaE